MGAWFSGFLGGIGRVFENEGFWAVILVYGWIGHGDFVGIAVDV